MSAARGPVFELIETRRIKSNVLHYFDHPRFGMIAKVTPYISSEADITSEEETLEEPVADETGMDQLNPADDQLTR